MPSALRDGQHELVSDDGALSLLFGTEDTSYQTTAYPVIGSSGDRNGDVQRFREDGIGFGEDFEGAKTATFEIAVLTDRAVDPHVAGSDALSDFEYVWKHRSLRNKSTRYAVLRSQLVPGRTRRAYGRPRRYAEAAGRLTRKGMTPIVCDFVAEDGRWYDDAAQVVSASLVSPVDGGLIAPLVTPLTSIPATSGASAMTVRGKKDTWPVVTFHGPVTNPSLDFGPFTIGLTTTIPDGQTVTVDTRPWVRKVTRSDGASLAGALTHDTPPLRKCLLDPGTYQLVYIGTDQTGTSYAEVSWRNAYPRW